MGGTEKLQSTTNRSGTAQPLTDANRSSYGADDWGVRFYEGVRSLARVVGEFLAEGLQQGNPGIIIATAEQRAAIVQELMDRSLDALALQRSQDLVLLDAEQTLSTFMVDGQPDAQKFRDEMCRLVKSATRSRARCAIRVFGQLVDVLWQNGQREAAIRLELLWNQLARAEPSTLVCGYAIGNFFKQTRVENACESRSHFASAEDKTTTQAVSVASDTGRHRPKRERRE